MNFETRDDVIRLAENLHLISGPGGSRFPHCNGFLITTGEETVLFDAGIGDKIKEIDREKRIDTLIISHSHPDHILAWHLLKDRRILLPAETPDSVMDLKLLGRRFTVNEKNAAYWTGFAGGKLGVRALREPDGRFGNGEILELGEFRFEAIHAPGHLSDHYCFFERGSGILLSTDIDLTSFGPWYGNPECDIEQFILDLKTLMALPYSVVCSSHKTPVKEEAAEKFESFLCAFDRQRQTILDLCDSPRTLDRMTEMSPFYRDRAANKTLQSFFERVMIGKNLDILVRDGFVNEKKGVYRRT